MRQDDRGAPGYTEGVAARAAAAARTVPGAGRMRGRCIQWSAMRTRLIHALRFAVTTLVAVYAVGVAWELLDVYLLGNSDPGLGSWDTFVANERIWRAVSFIEAIVVFLVKLGDLRADAPSWAFAWIAALWLGLATSGVAVAIEHGLLWLVPLLVIVAVVAWYAMRRRIPGCPGTGEHRIAAGASAGRELH